MAIEFSHHQLLDFLNADSIRRKERVTELAALIQQVPIPDALLHEIAWTGPTDQAEILRRHPGYALQAKLKSLETILQIFNRSSADLVKELERFHVFSHSKHFGRRMGEAELDEIEYAVKKELLAFSTAAAALVDHARIVEKEISVPDYKHQQLAFFDAGEHRFIKVLRNLINHARFPDVSWQIKHGANRERLTDFVLPTGQLLELEALQEDANAMTYVEQSGKDIHLREVVRSYANRVVDFYAWHASVVTTNAPVSLIDYQRCVAYCNTQMARAMWRLLLTQTKADPYEHLDLYLLPEQIEEARKLPMRTKKQVDYIIAAADKNAACDDEIRELAYKYFGVN